MIQQLIFHIYTQKHKNTGICSNIIHNSPQLETSQGPIKRWINNMDIQTENYPALKTERILDKNYNVDK